MLLALLIVKIALLGLSVRDIHEKPFAPWRKILLHVPRLVPKTAEECPKLLLTALQVHGKDHPLRVGILLHSSHRQAG